MSSGEVVLSDVSPAGPPAAVMPQAPEPLDDGCAPPPASARESASATPLRMPLECSPVAGLTTGSECARSSSETSSTLHSLADIIERLRREVLNLREELPSQVDSGMQRAVGPLAAALAPMLGGETPALLPRRSERASSVASQQGQADRGLLLSPNFLRSPCSHHAPNPEPLGADTSHPLKHVRVSCTQGAPSGCSSGDQSPAARQGSAEVSHGFWPCRSHSVKDLDEVVMQSPSASGSHGRLSGKHTLPLATPYHNAGVQRPNGFRAMTTDFNKVRSIDKRLDIDDLPDDDVMRRLMGSRKFLISKHRSQTRLQLMLDLGEEPERRSRVAQFMSGDSYQKFVAVVILVNLLFVGYRADYTVQNPEHTAQHILAIEVAFLIYFTLEVLVSASIHGVFFFVGRAWRWNWLELFIVVLSGVNLTLEMLNISFESPFIRPDQMRILRMLQATTILRAFRGVQVLHELSSLLRSIHGSLHSLGWSLAMLVMIFYFFSIFFVGAAGDVRGSKDLDEDTEKKIMERFGTVLTALTSLFTASLGGVDWEDFAEILKKAGMFYYIVFLAFIAFVVLAALNILTGVFVERAIFVDQNDFRAMGVIEQRREKGLVKEFSRLFYAIHLRSRRDATFSLSVSNVISQKLTISREDFEDYMENVNGIRHLFAVLGLKIWDPAFFFSVLSRASKDDQVDIETFVDVCMQLRGPATVFDLQCLLESMEASAVHS